MKKSNNYLRLTHREIEMIKFFLKFNTASLLILICWFYPAYVLIPEIKEIHDIPEPAALITPAKAEVATTTPEIVKIPASAGVIRTITAYNAGDPFQTDDTPCDGAGGNICEMLAAGRKICAANFVPLGSWLRIENFGDCQVLDRMSKKYPNRVDIAMRLDEKERAKKFGRQNLLVEILK